MKKIILIVLLLMTENIMAEDYYARISLGQQNGKDGQQDATEGGFVLGLKLNSNVSTEIKVAHKQKDNKGFSTRIGAAIIGKVKLLDNLKKQLQQSETTIMHLRQKKLLDIFMLFCIAKRLQIPMPNF